MPIIAMKESIITTIESIVAIIDADTPQPPQTLLHKPPRAGGFPLAGPFSLLHIRPPTLPVGRVALTAILARIFDESFTRATTFKKKLAENITESNRIPPN